MGGHLFNAASLSLMALGIVTLKGLTSLSKAATAAASFAWMMIDAERNDSCNRADWRILTRVLQLLVCFFGCLTLFPRS